MERDCGWSMTDRHGYAYPHGIPATKRVTGAGELLDGYYCNYHARRAVKQSKAEALAEQE